MLRLLTDRCLVAVSAKGIAVVQAAAFGRRIYDKQFYPIDTDITKDINLLYPLLNQILLKHSKQKLQQLQVILSTDFTRFMVLPAQTSLLSTLDQLAYAKALYQEVYGDLCEEWVLAPDDAPPYQPVLCAAIDQILLEQLKSMAIQHRFNLSSVAPYVTYLINQFNLKAYEGYLVIVEPSRLVFIEFKGALQNIQQVKWKDEWIAPLQKMLNKTLLCSRLSGQKLTIYAPMQKDLDAAQFSNWDVTLIKPLASVLERTQHYQMLLGCV